MPGMHAPSAPILCSFSNPDELVDSLAQFIIKSQKEALQKKGKFTVAISGGSLPKQLNGLIGKPGVKWDKWYRVTPVALLDIPVLIQTRSLSRLQAGLLRGRAYCPPRS